MTTDYQPSDVFHYGMKVEDMDKAIEDWQAIGADVLMAPVEAEGVGVFCAILLFRGMVFELVAPAADAAQKSGETRSRCDRVRSIMSPICRTTSRRIWQS